MVGCNKAKIRYVYVCLKWWWKNTKTKYENKFHSFLSAISSTQIIPALKEEFVNSFGVDDYSWRSVIAFVWGQCKVFAFVLFPFKSVTNSVYKKCRSTRAVKNVKPVNLHILQGW